MKTKAAFVIGAGLGYLFGTKAGRERFEQIKGWANQTWNDPKVQAKVSEYGSTAAQAAKDRGSAIAGKLRSGSSSDESGTGTDRSAYGAGTAGAESDTGSQWSTYSSGAPGGDGDIGSDRPTTPPPSGL